MNILAICLSMTRERTGVMDIGLFWEGNEG